MTHLKIFITALVVLVLFSLFLRTQIDTREAEPASDSVETIDQTDSINKTPEPEKSPILWVPKQPDHPPDDDMRSTNNVNEKNTETVVCPDDVYVCGGGGYGTPNFDTELRRVPPTCEFPACPG